MEEQDHVRDIPIWQNHEQRITALEVTIHGMKGEFKEIKDAINSSNKTQSDKLDMIHNKLLNEFFNTKKEKRKMYVSILGYLLGGGSILYLALEKLLGGV